VGNGSIIAVGTIVSPVASPNAIAVDVPVKIMEFDTPNNEFEKLLEIAQRNCGIDK
jgi:hypothetical protein